MGGLYNFVGYLSIMIFIVKFDINPLYQFALEVEFDFENLQIDIDSGSPHQNFLIIDFLQTLLPAGKVVESMNFMIERFLTMQIFLTKLLPNS